MLAQIVGVLGCLLPLIVGQLHPTEPATYKSLPSLREQARIQDKWKDARIKNIPNLLDKYGVDGWLVCSMHSRRLDLDSLIHGLRCLSASTLRT